MIIVRKINRDPVINMNRNAQKMIGDDHGIYGETINLAKITKKDERKLPTATRTAISIETKRRKARYKPIFAKIIIVGITIIAKLTKNSGLSRKVNVSSLKNIAPTRARNRANISKHI